MAQCDDGFGPHISTQYTFMVKHFKAKFLSTNSRRPFFWKKTTDESHQHQQLGLRVIGHSVIDAKVWIAWIASKQRRQSICVKKKKSKHSQKQTAGSQTWRWKEDDVQRWFVRFLPAFLVTHPAGHPWCRRFICQPMFQWKRQIVKGEIKAGTTTCPLFQGLLSLPLFAHMCISAIDRYYPCSFNRFYLQPGSI